MKLLKDHFFLIGILLLALVIRVINLGAIPQSFHTDELAAGYIGRYIFLHGTDIFGNLFPLYINKFGDFRPIGIFWFSGLSTFLFGVNEFAVRLPGAFFGALTTIPLYLLTLEIFKSKKGALLSASALAILPWHIVLSRATSEGIIGLFLLVTSLYFGFLYLRTGKKKHLILSLVFGISTYFLYHVFRLLMPLLFAPLVIYATKDKRKLMGALTILFFLITIGMALTSSGSGRFSQVAFYKNENLSAQINGLITAEGQNNVTDARIFHNKAVVYGREFINLYATYFSVDFLLKDKGLPARYVVPSHGLLFYSFAPLLILFLIFFVPNFRKSKNATFILYLLLITPLPAALTNEDSPNLHRSMLLILPFTIMIGVGLGTLLDLLKKKYQITLCAILGFFVLLELIFFAHQYSVHSKSHLPFYRNEGNKQVIEYVIENQSKYSHIYLPSIDDLPLYYLFFKNNFEKVENGKFGVKFKTDTLDNIIFIDDGCIGKRVKEKSLTLEPNSLIIEDAQCEKLDKVGYQEIVERSDSTKAYRIASPDLNTEK